MKKFLKKNFTIQVETLTSQSERLIEQIEAGLITKTRIEFILNKEDEKINYKNKFYVNIGLFLVFLILILFPSNLLYEHTKFQLFIWIFFGLVFFACFPSLFFAYRKDASQYSKLIEMLRTEKFNNEELNKFPSLVRILVDKLKENKFDKAQERIKLFDTNAIAACVYFLRKTGKFPSNNQTSNIVFGDFLVQLTGCSPDIRKFIEDPFLRKSKDESISTILKVKDSFHKISYYDSDPFIELELKRQEEKIKTKKFLN
jgi:hypothetical protein